MLILKIVGWISLGKRGWVGGGLGNICMGVGKWRGFRKVMVVLPIGGEEDEGGEAFERKEMGGLFMG